MKYSNRTYDTSVIFNSPSVHLRSMIENQAEQEARKSPADFCGEKACIFYKLNYVYPYEKMDGLRRYILAVRDRTGLRNRFKGIIAIDLTAWAEHIDEDYFRVFIMYFADHTEGIRYMLIFGSRDTGQKEMILSTLRQYMRVRAVEPAKLGGDLPVKQLRREDH